MLPGRGLNNAQMINVSRHQATGYRNHATDMKEQATGTVEAIEAGNRIEETWRQK
jgi:hypothetical protein